MTIDTSNVCVFDGWLSYNDTKQLSQLMKQLNENPHSSLKGINMIPSLLSINGLYQMVLYNKEHRDLIILVDRYGFHYFYTYEDEDIFLFSFQLKALLTYKSIDTTIDYLAIADFLNFGFIIGDKTFLKSVKLSPYGSYITGNDYGIKANRYWSFPCKINVRDEPEDFLASSLAVKLEEAITERANSKEHVGVSLSGGLDSRTIAAFLVKAGRRPLCFHYANLSKETNSAKRISKDLEVDLVVTPFSHNYYINNIRKTSWLTDGHISLHQIWLFGQALEISNRFPQYLVFDGLGLDFLFNMYNFLLNGDRAVFRSSDIVNQLHLCYTPLNHQLIERVFLPEFSEMLKDSQHRGVSSFLEDFNTEDLSLLSSYFYFRNRSRRYVWGMNRLNALYMQSAFPGMDYGLFDFGIELSGIARSSGSIYKRMIWEQFPKLRDIPYPRTGKPIDSESSPFWAHMKRYRRLLYYYIERAFVGNINLNLPAINGNYLFRRNREFRESILAIVMDERIFSRKLVSREGLKWLLKIQSHGVNVFGTLQAIIGVELFFRMMLEGDSHFDNS